MDADVMIIGESTAGLMCGAATGESDGNVMLGVGLTAVINLILFALVLTVLKKAGG